MRIVLQRVREAWVEVNGATTGSIGDGLLVLLGIKTGDTSADVEYLAGKVANLRVFRDSEGKMNRSVKETGGGVLLVSQFTLYGDCRKGRRPSFTEAAAPEEARGLYEHFAARLRAEALAVETGIFQAEMQVHLVNDGPVTLVLDSTTKI